MLANYITNNLVELAWPVLLNPGHLSGRLGLLAAARTFGFLRFNLHFILKVSVKFVLIRFKVSLQSCCLFLCQNRNFNFKVPETPTGKLKNENLKGSWGLSGATFGPCLVTRPTNTLKSHLNCPKFKGNLKTR